ncbi:papilin-like isoform X2 [Ornithodoros turicata]|uniref:papilin-like isoform X2 n=1 Tax=Ornithodoros turicata TaxID=34597 RepID=UPI0031394FD6
MIVPARFPGPSPEELGAPPEELLQPEPSDGAPPQSLSSGFVRSDALQAKHKRAIITKTAVAAAVAIGLVAVGVTIYMTVDTGSSVEEPGDDMMNVPQTIDPRVIVPTRSRNTTHPTSQNDSATEHKNDSRHRTYEDECNAVKLENCSSNNVSVWYATSDDCYQWKPYTLCPHTVDSFVSKNTCLSTCLDGLCSGVNDATDLRRCKTADKEYQWFAFDGRCHHLNDSDDGCLDGVNRFRNETECLEACSGSKSNTRCMQEKVLTDEACTTGRISSYVFEATTKTCVPAAFCASTSFASYAACRDACIIA